MAVDPGIGAVISQAAASPVNVGVQYAPMTTPTGTFNLGPLIEQSRDLVRQMQRERAAEGEAAEKKAVQDAEAFVALRGGDLVRSTEDEYERLVREAGGGEAAFPAFQERVAQLSGRQAVSRNYRARAMAEMGDRFSILDQFGNEQNPEDPAAFLDRIWGQTVEGTAVLQTTPGLSGALEAKRAFDLEFIREVETQQAKQRHEYGGALQEQNFFETAQFLLQKSNPTDMDIALFQGQLASSAVIDKRARTDPAALQQRLFSGVKQAFLAAQDQDPQKVLGLLPALGTVKLPNGRRIGDDADGVKMLLELRTKANDTRERLERDGPAQAERQEKLERRAFSERFFEQVATDLDAAVPESQIRQNLLGQIPRGSRNRKALEQEIDDMLRVGARARDAGDTALFGRLSRQVDLGQGIDEQLATKAIQDSLSAEQFGQLTKANRQLKNVSSVMAQTDFPAARRELSNLIAEEFRGSGAVGTVARIELGTVAQDYLRSLDSRARALAQANDIDGLNALALEERDVEGKTRKAIQASIDVWRQSREETRIEIESAIRSGSSQAERLRDADVTRYLTTSEIQRLQRWSERATDWTLLVGHGSDRAMRLRSLEREVYGRLVPRGVLGMLAEEDPATKTQAQSIVAGVTAALETMLPAIRSRAGTLEDYEIAARTEFSALLDASIAMVRGQQATPAPAGK